MTPPTPPPVTLIIDVDDDTRVLQAARASSDPQAGQATVDLTPHTPRTAYLPRDILRALGRTDYQPTASEPITAAPAWRAAACWITVLGIRRLVILRAHHLAEARTRHIAQLRQDTGIHLVLIAQPPTRTAAAQLRTRLARHHLDHDLQQITDSHEALDLLGPPTPHRPQPVPDHTMPLPDLPRLPVARFRAELRRCLPAADFARVDAQYWAGLYAARAYLTRHPGLPTQQDLEFFLSRLTTSSPSLRHTLTRLRGAQAGFLRAGLLLDLPDDLETATGPGTTTRPFTPYTAHRISRGIPHPLQLAALTALLTTGTHPDALYATPVAALDERCTRLAVPDVWHPEHGSTTPPPAVAYAVPPRARPVLRTALRFRRSEQAQDHFLLFSSSFGHRLTDLAHDAAVDIPALGPLQPGPDWHHRARCARPATTTPHTSTDQPPQHHPRTKEELQLAAPPHLLSSHQRAELLATIGPPTDTALPHDQAAPVVEILRHYLGSRRPPVSVSEDLLADVRFGEEGLGCSGFLAIDAGSFLCWSLAVSAG
ncbi:hypothetical protein C9F11_42570 [Streptomyces sp. YIM 121038]|uniref:hypothetical protein n=1 Tax=Streptomyces sp. YIM 121038 TaxID=2136401 RepID=UPI001110868C|nr:hypothetical protein [Streptomyces sp. YIM 121038]QCX73725.1 hypothetical protein C9F11_00110 [Streptomyces sp. YIM 121038]QCX82094.1 hypothetical protein C9F11_42570 [Streptomyces sp. YIM 121038]